MKRLVLLILGLMLITACIQQEKAEPEKVVKSVQGDKAPREQKDLEKPLPPPPAPKPALSFKILWSFTTGGDVYGVALSGNGTRAAVGSYDGFVYLIDEKGEKVWDFKTRGGVHDVAMPEDGGYVAAVSYVYDEATVYLLSGDGRELWSIRVPGLSKGVDVDGEGRVAVASYMDKLYMMKDGGVIWEYALPESAYGAWDVVISGDKVVAVDDNAYLYTFNMRGELLQKIRVAQRDYTYGVAAAPGGYVAVATQDKGVYLYKDGRLKWRRGTGFSNYAAAISEKAELIAVGSWDKYLYVYGIDGELLHKHPVGGNVNRVDFSDNRLIFGSSDGRAYLAEAQLTPGG